MEIPTNKGANIDTNKLSDYDSLLIEKAKELVDLCILYHRQIWVVLDAKVNLPGSAGGIALSNFNEDNPSDQTREKSKEMLLRVHGALNQTFSGNAGVWIRNDLNGEIICLKDNFQQQ